MKELRSLSALPNWVNGSGIDNDVVISSTVSVSRNLAKYKFPDRCSAGEKREIYTTVSSAISHSDSCDKFTLYNFDKIEKLKQFLLIETRVIDTHMLASVGDRGVVCDKKQSSTVSINGLNHIQIRKSVPGFNPKNSWNWVDKCDNDLGAILDYSFDPKKGFLTSNPKIAGSALQCEFIVYLPALILTGTIDSVLSGASQMGISAQGLFGSLGEVPGSLFQLVSIAHIGSSEVDAISDVSEVIAKIIESERNARQALLSDAKFEISDKISRSYGILKYAKRLTFNELLNLSSALRFASLIDMNITTNPAYYNSLILKNMPARMEVRVGNQLSVQGQEIERAFFAKEWLKEININNIFDWQT